MSRFIDFVIQMQAGILRNDLQDKVRYIYQPAFIETEIHLSFKSAIA